MELQLKEEVTAKCPFCKGTFTAGTTPSGTGAVLHTMPMCAKFEQLSPLDFLTAAVREKGHN